MDDLFDFNIKKVNQTTSFKDQEQKKRHKPKEKKDEQQENEAKNHFAELSASVECIHRILEQKKSPFRFCVFMEGDEVFIDIVILDGQGRISKTIKKNITHQEFLEIIRNIETQDGLIVDYTV